VLKLVGAAALRQFEGAETINWSIAFASPAVKGSEEGVTIAALAVGETACREAILASRARSSGWRLFRFECLKALMSMKRGIAPNSESGVMA
jgi:hypothetical protein